MRALVVASLLALCACPSSPVSLAGKSSGASKVDGQKKIPLSGTATASGKAR